ncbi:MAG: cytochrome c oxidase subunit 3, partial [Planctomycetota bacterium]
KDAKKAVLPALFALLLGMFFVGAQGMEWVALLGEGLTLTSSTYGAFFYVIVGTHGLHAVAAILGLGWAWVRLQRGKLTASEFGTVQVFWYFVVLVWPVLYLKVYL